MQRKTLMVNKRKRKKKRKTLQVKLSQILFLSLLVLLILFADAYRRGSVKLYQGSSNNPAGGKTVRTVSEPKAEQTTGPVEDNKQAEGRKADMQKIRILLTTSNFGSLYHEQLVIAGTKGMTLSQGKQEKKYSAGEKVSLSSLKDTKEKAVFRPEAGGRLQLLSVTRQNRHPKYRGTIEVRQTAQGLNLINELTMGEYLYAVVSSELSTGHPMEALKAQAVCARTYASNHIRSERYERYGADMDDSIACQVYNNISEDKRSRQAVKATAGEVLTKDGKLVSTYYYSTSWGKSASGQEVWNTASGTAHLQSCVQTESRGDGAEFNLSDESAFRKFLVSKDIITYDSDASWYRWKVKIPAADLTERIDSLLAECYQSNPDMVLTQTASGKYRKKALRSLGTVRKMRVEKRERSGLVTELVVVGTENVVKVCSQYNVRKVLSPGNARIYYGGGKTNMSVLPSAAFYLDDITEEDGSLSFEIHGGGCGHGTGMSQCGAAKMAEMGKQYRDILKYYFSGCESAVKSIKR